MKSLVPPEDIQTREGKKKVTHEAYNYVITPYCSPPIQVEIVKGCITHGKFKPIPESAMKFMISLEEYKLLISPNDKGKPAGDFRLSDIVGMIRKRQQPAVSSESPAATEETADGNPAVETAAADAASAEAAPVEAVPEQPAPALENGSKAA